MEFVAAKHSHTTEGDQQETVRLMAPNLQVVLLVVGPVGREEHYC